MRQDREALLFVSLNLMHEQRVEVTGLTPVELSSSGRLRTWRVTCTSVRGMLRVKMMLRSVL